eukprot:5967093-Pleurochrysis_carterae.AAC.1
MGYTAPAKPSSAVVGGRKKGAKRATSHQRRKLNAEEGEGEGTDDDWNDIDDAASNNVVEAIDASA